MTTENLLLDTCALIWLGNGQGELSAESMRAIADADNLYISTVSLWEISNKCRQGKLHLLQPVRLWFDSLCKRLSLTVISPTAEEMIMAGELPEHHKDPADRMIISQALRTGMPVVTKDHNFAKYGVRIVS